MKTLIRIADVIDRSWRGFWWYVLEAIGIGLLAWAAYRDYSPWWGIGVLVAGVLATVAAALQRARARRARRRPVVTPPRESWPVIHLLPPVGPPPPHRVDKAIVHAAINGLPLTRPLTIHERYRAAAFCAWRGDDIDRIADNLGCTAAKVRLLLAIQPPAKAASLR